MLTNRHQRSLIILFDGRCGLCKKTMRFLCFFDWLHRLDFRNLYDPAVREQFTPTISLASLEREMHVILSNKKIVQGFYSIREICRNVPILWILVPFLYLPFVPTLGECVYGWVAGHRK